MPKPLDVNVLPLNRCFVESTAVLLSSLGDLTLLMSTPPGMLLKELCTSNVIQEDR